MQMFDSIIDLLPESIKNALEGITNINSVEEIRLRVNRPIELITFEKKFFLDKTAKKEDILHILNMGARNSLFAREEEIRNGFITVKGGSRIGFTGQAVRLDGNVKSLCNFNSLNIRFAREIKGCASFILPYIHNKDKLLSCLFIAPPGAGKTTLLRDLTRLISNGFDGTQGIKTGLIDERGEIAACLEGIPQLDIGLRTDVLDNFPKAQGVMLLIRTMSPEVIITDEIGGESDYEALIQAASCGVKIIASAHGECIEELLSKAYINKIIKHRIFDRYLFIQRSNNILKIKKIYSSSLKEVDVF